jgi:hypothetical protein
MIVVNNAALCALAFAFILVLSLVRRGWWARRLCQLYALFKWSYPISHPTFAGEGGKEEERKSPERRATESLTAWIQKPGSGETISIRRDCE